MPFKAWKMSILYLLRNNLKQVSENSRKKFVVKITLMEVVKNHLMLIMLIKTQEKKDGENLQWKSN